MRLPRTLRTRLALVVVAVLSVAVVLAGVATYELTSRSLMERADRQVTALAPPDVQGTLRMAVENPQRAPASVQQGDTPPQLRADVLFAVAGPTRTFQFSPAPAAGATASDGLSLSAAERARIEAAGGRPVLLTVALPSGDYRVAARSVAGTRAIMLFGQPLRDVQDTLSRLVIVLVVVGVVMLAAAAAATLLVLRIGLRPLDRVVAAADQIAGRDLSYRVGMEDAPREVARVARAFDAMLGRIQEAFARRRASEDRIRAFAADASHELRTPLTSIRGYAELYRRGAARSPAEVERAMTRIEAEAERMSEIVESLLLLARLDEAPASGLGPVWLAPVIRDVVDDARAAHPDHAYVTDVAGDVVVHGDEAQIRRALVNLVGNAGVHTPPGSRVEVTLRGGDAGAVLTVRDDGPGLPPGDPGALFGRFVRGDASRTRAAGGSGLGLAIVEAVARRHGGAVAAGPAEGGGAVLTLRLPVETGTRARTEPR